MAEYSAVVKVAAQWVAQEVKYLYGVRDKVEELHNELMWMHCFLSDADAKQLRDAATRNWVSQIKDYSCDAEDIIEKYILKVSCKDRHKGLWSILKWFSSLLISDGKALYEVGSDIDALTEKISRLTSRMQAYGLTSMYEKISTNHPVKERSRSTYSHRDGSKEDATVIGIEDDIKSLADQLVNDQDHKVILLHGMGGRGKSTLASKVYNHDAVRIHFSGFAWVTVSQQFQTRNVVMEILLQLIEDEHLYDKTLKEKKHSENIQGSEEEQKQPHENFSSTQKLDQPGHNRPPPPPTTPCSSGALSRDASLPPKKGSKPYEALKEERRREIEGLGEGQLVEKLYKTLEKNKYLVVLDDIWTTDDWKLRLQVAFPVKDDKMIASKIMITTRNAELLPENLRSLVLYHEPKELDEDKCWELLKIKAFGETPESTDARLEDLDEKFTQKKELGKKMLERCKGLPLAIVVLGGVLATKSTLEEWQKVHENIDLYLGRQNMVHSRSFNGVYDVLAMSYYDLPYHLKPCFLYLGSFPEDYDIPAEKLFHMWIAEGLVTPPVIHGTLEADAESYLNELVQKHMVQAVERKSDGKVKSCRLDNLMRDVCLQIAEGDNFLRVVGGRRHNAHSDDKHLSVSPSTRLLLNNRLRRLAIYVSRGIKGYLVDFSSGKAQNLRSLLLFPAEQCKEADFRWMWYVKKVCEEFPLLRVLDLEGFHHVKGKLPRQVGKLIYLRFLSLKGTRVNELPSSIGNLIFLETLDLRVADVVLMLPNLLWKLARLRYLYLPSRRLSLQEAPGYKIRKRAMLRLDGLSHLEILKGIDLERVDEREPLGLRKIRKLSATCVSKQEILRPFLQSKSVESLSLKVDGGIVSKEPMILSTSQSLRNLDIDLDGCSDISVPLSVGMLPDSLVKLGFWYCNLKQDPMPILEKLPQLRSLGLHICYDGRELVCSAEGFPQLTSLMIDGLIELEEWRVEPGALSNLKKLEIYNSPIKNLPDDLPDSVDIACDPCIPGIAKYRTCPFDKK
ncbi:hypothetical protein Dimus_002607 [Dionaea muscipula]